MNSFFSICSNGYLAQARVLGRSLKKFHPTIPFILFLCDRKSPSVNYNEFADEVIELESIEEQLHELALKYNILELVTCFKPKAFEYLLGEKKYEKVIYLDSDIWIFHSLEHLFLQLNNANILLTPHIFSALPLDDKKPDEQSFLIFGIYNTGFVGVSNTEESKRFLAWWKIRTYKYGFMDTYKGLYVDQLPVNMVPLFFKSVHILSDRGLNMGPWNLHERFLTYREGKIFVNENETLKFYHFSSFITGELELPLHFYNRYRLQERADLLPIYQNYQQELLDAGYARFHKIENAYAANRKSHLQRMKRKKWIKKFLP